MLRRDRRWEKKSVKEQMADQSLKRRRSSIVEQVFPGARGEPSQPGEKCEEGAEERCYELTTTPSFHPPLYCFGEEEVK